jgi:hypothetical protein
MLRQPTNHPPIGAASVRNRQRKGKRAIVSSQTLFAILATTASHARLRFLQMIDSRADECSIKEYEGTVLSHFAGQNKRSRTTSGLFGLTLPQTFDKLCQKCK